MLPNPLTPRPLPARAAQETKERPRVLVVEDDDLIRGVVAAFLREEGYDVREAPHGGVALQLVAERQPSLILLDWHMPHVDGWQFATTYHAKYNGSSAPILCMTAAHDATRRAESIQAAAVLPKPFALDDLLDVVGRLAGVPVN